jgi:alkylation response protein AidB-like acyl-CoA dehydrogenase
MSKTLFNEYEWPEQQLREMSDAMRWAMPRDFGGDDLDPLELHLRYEQLARRSLPPALLLTQRDSAVGIIAGSTNRATRDRLLAEIRDGMFVSVSLAHLTTSRQHGAPALTATRVGSDYRLDGYAPWASGAAKARYVVAGAALEGGEQMLFALPTAQAGVTVEPPMPLVSMRSTWTSEVRCEGVVLPREFVLAGPMPNVLSTRRKSVPLPQAFLALGHARGAIDLIAQHDSERGRSLADRFTAQLDALHTEVVTACRPDANPADVPRLRGECTDLALRVTHAAVALYKGNALMMSHPAQRLAREALFLLVWSCPDSVIDCTVELLSTDGRSIS